MNIRVKLTREVNYKFYKVPKNGVVELELEDYLTHVVPSEMTTYFPYEALRAQAICSRTYAVNKMRASATFDLDDTTSYQSFNVTKSSQITTNAVESTKGLVIKYKVNPILCVYCASNGGKCVSAEEHWGKIYPYLRAAADPWDSAAGYPKSGHGVGMSQRGAQYAASHGMSYSNILKFYYPETSIKSM